MISVSSVSRNIKIMTLVVYDKDLLKQIRSWIIRNYNLEGRIRIDIDTCKKISPIKVFTDATNSEDYKYVSFNYLYNRANEKDQLSSLDIFLLTSKIMDLDFNG